MRGLHRGGGRHRRDRAIAPPGSRGESRDLRPQPQGLSGPRAGPDPRASGGGRGVKLAFAVRPDWDVAAAAARDAATRARAKGHGGAEVKLDSPSLAREVAGAEVAIVFGGDGTMLRAA